MFSLFTIALAVCLVATFSNNSRADPVPDTSDECMACKAEVNEVSEVWSNSTTIDEILKNLDRQCTMKYKTDVKALAKCQAKAAVFVQIPPSIFHGMEDLAWPIPDGMCATLYQCKMTCCGPNDPPEQVHLSLASSDKSLMGVSWVTLNEESSVVQYGTSADDLSMSNSGIPTTNYNGGNWIGTIHRATMTGLKQGTKYFYRVGDGSSRWSEVFDFTVMHDDDVITYAIIGDIYFDSANTMANVNKLVQDGKVQVVVHSGDESYADGYEPHWDLFFNRIQPWAARVPYMAAAGNHEFWYNFSSYKNRFFLPGVVDAGGSGDNMFYSWDAGYTHWVTGNSETAVDTANFADEYLAFLEEDLSKVDRSKTPFVTVNFHRPMYCSNDDECVTKASKLKSQSEDILLRHKVDLVIGGHVHAYERTYPVAKEASTQRDYVNPSAPTYIVQGASGNRENNKGPYSNLPEWSAFNDQSIGFGLLTVSRTSMDWKFLASVSEGEPILKDSFILTRPPAAKV